MRQIYFGRKKSEEERIFHSAGFTELRSDERLRSASGFFVQGAAGCRQTKRLESDG